MQNEAFRANWRKPSEELANPLQSLNTIEESYLHRFVGDSNKIGLIPKLYIMAVALTFLPLVVAASFSPFSLAEPYGSIKLPLLLDWNVLFMFLVSFPYLLILTAKDQTMLLNSLSIVYREGTILISPSDANFLCQRWRKIFRLTNRYGQLCGMVVGVIVAYCNYLIYVPSKVGYWIAQNNTLLPVGFVYLYCIVLFYALVSLYICRNIAISLFLKDVVHNAELHLLPMHPDKSGGLRPVGRLGLQNQYVLSLFGMNIVFMIMVSYFHLNISPMLYNLLVAAVVSYLILGPVVFVAPLLPFRDGMIRTKADLMEEIAVRLRLELDRLRTQLVGGPISKDDEEIIDRLRKLASVIDDLPVWPFDAITLRKFLSAYIIPILSSAGLPAVKTIFDFFKVHLN